MLLFSLEEWCGLSVEQTWVPFIQDNCMPSLLEIYTMVLQMIFKFCQCFSLFRNNLPMGKSMPLHFNTLESPLRLWCFEQSLVKIGKLILEKIFKENENMLSLQTDGRWTLGDQKSSLEQKLRWGKQNCTLYTAPNPPLPILHISVNSELYLDVWTISSVDTKDIWWGSL